MNSVHLTDEMLQAFLLKEVQDNSIATHIAECATCTERLEAYQHLIDSVQQMKPESFSFDMTTLAMNCIFLYEQKKSKKQEWFYWGMMILPVIVVSSFAIPFIPNILAMFYSNSVFTTLLVTGTGLAVLLFLLADIIRQYKMKEEKLFKDFLQPKL